MQSVRPPTHREPPGADRNEYTRDVVDAAHNLMNRVPKLWSLLFVGITEAGENPVQLRDTIHIIVRGINHVPRVFSSIRPRGLTAGWLSSGLHGAHDMND